MEQENRSAGHKKLSTRFKRRIVRKVKKKSSSTSKIVKSLVDAPCNTKTIKRHLGNEKIKHKKRIHCERLTMKHKEKRLVYACQYQTMSAKEWRKVTFSPEKNFSLDSPDSFQEYRHAKNFPEENYSTMHSGEESLMSCWVFSSSGKLKLQFVCGRQNLADYVKMLNDLSFEKRRVSSM